MIKLKKLLESKNAFRREFGEPLPTLTDVMVKHQVEEKEQLNEGIDLYSHYKKAHDSITDFLLKLDSKRGGSFDSDSVEYEDDRWNNDSKMLKSRDKKLGQWEKKVNKALNGLIKDYEKAW